MNLRSLYLRVSASHTIIRFFFLITTFEGLAGLLFLLSLPKSASNGWLFGYSLNRMVLILGMLLVDLVLIWTTSNILRNAELEQKFYALLKSLVAHNRQLEQVLTTLSAGFIVAVFLLVLWVFTKDAYYLAYLLRFGPVIIFGMLVIVQMLVVLLSQSPQITRTAWLWSLLFVGFLIFLQEWPLIQFNKLGNIFLVLLMFLITLHAQTLFRRGIQMSRKKQLGWLVAAISVGLFLYIELFFIPKKFLIYRQSFFIFSPMILLSLVVCTQLIHRFFLRLSRNVGTRILMHLIILAGFIYAGKLYYYAGSIHAEQINTTYAPYDDELSYMNFAIKASQTNFQYTGERNQMPVYPYIQAIFYEKDMSLDDFFVRGKQVNIFLSMISLAVVFLFVKKILPLYIGINLILITAFGLYVFKSGYFMVELLYYALGALAYLLLCIMLVRPSIKLSIGTGIILGISHLTKASVLPALLLFVGVFMVKELFEAYYGWKNRMLNGENEKSALKIRLASLLLTLVCYIAVISPYIVESKRIYGDYFYNVNSTFYMWNDSWEEAMQQTMAHGDAQGWPDMPPEDIPSFGKYFREHNLEQVRARIQYGLHWQIENIRYQYSFFNYPILFLVFAFIMFFLDVKRSLQVVKKYFPLVAFVAFYFMAYAGLYIWYSPIANLPRFIYTLYLPLLLSISVGAKKLAGEISLPLVKLTNLAIFVMILIDVWYIISQGPFNRDFGS